MNVKILVIAAIIAIANLVVDAIIVGRSEKYIKEGKYLSARNTTTTLVPWNCAFCIFWIILCMYLSSMYIYDNHMLCAIAISAFLLGGLNILYCINRNAVASKAVIEAY